MAEHLAQQFVDLRQVCLATERRLASEEAAALERAAERASESTSEYVRKAIEIRQGGTAVPPTVNISSGAFGMQVNQWVTWTEAPDSYTPDEVEQKVTTSK